MGSGYLTNPLAFLIDTLFSLYILAVMLRFLLQWLRADFFNPIAQFLVRITQPVLKPLRRVIPGLWGIDFAALVLMILLQMLALGVLMLIYGMAPQPVYLLLRTPAELVSLLLNIYLVAIIIQAILSWVSRGGYNPAETLLYSLTEPVLRPFRQFIPLVGGIDLSPLAAIIFIQILKMLILPPLNHLAPPII